jgi:uncharacterized protein YndB with AHSA1/START domain
MALKTIRKTVTIDAAPDRVWEILTEDTHYRAWAAEFAEGSHAETDWNEGSRAVFTDGSGFGMLARVVTSRPGELLDLEFEGLVADGREDTTSDEARVYRGAHETYRLTPAGTGTHLAIAADMGEEHHDDMAAAWDRALIRVQALGASSGPARP